MDKPEGCKGCPFYGDGKGFVPDKLNDQAEVFIYAQNPGASEETGKKWDGTSYTEHPIEPLIGKTGHSLDTQYLPVAGLQRDSISLGNALRCRHRHKDELPPLRSPVLQEAIGHCHRTHFRLPPKTRLIVAQGEYALFALTQEGWEKNNHVSDWRGYVLPFTPVGTAKRVETDIFNPSAAGSLLPVLSTFHIAYTFRDPTAVLVTRSDFQKIRSYLAGKWPERLPPIKSGPCQVWPAEAAFDTEYVPASKHFLSYQMYDGVSLRFSDVLEPPIASVSEHPTIIMQNVDADIGFLEQLLFGCKGFDYEDTMYAHAVLWSDFAHDLGFLGSLYGSLNRWKHLSSLNPIIYGGADAFVTWQVWRKLKAEFDRDPASWKLYRHQLKLIPIITAAQDAGIRVNPARARYWWEHYHDKYGELLLRAQAIAGWPINMQSNPQSSEHLFDVEGLLKCLSK